MPIIAMRFAFGGGDTQDPAGKEGLVNLMTGLFDEGAGDLDSDAFQSQARRCRRRNALRRGRDAIYGSMRMLADEKDEALELLRLADREAALRPGADRPHPQPDRLRHHRRRPRSRAPPRRSPGRRRSMATIPIRGQDEGTEQTLATITADDLQALHQPALRPRQSDRRRGRRDRCGDAEEGARPAVRRPAGEGRADAGRRCRAEARPGDRRSPTTCRRRRCSFAYPGVDRNEPEYLRRLSDEPHPGRRRLSPRGCSTKCAKSAALPTASARAGELRSRLRRW